MPVLLAEAAQDVSAQQFDNAMENALRALDLSAGDPLLKVQSLSTIVGIDIMASRDADAWEKALEAEAMKYIEQNGLTRKDAFVDAATEEVLLEKLEAEAVKDVTVSDDEVKALRQAAGMEDK